MPDYLSNLPPYMAALPLDDGGRPVPKFVEWIHDRPDFRVMDSRFLYRAVQERLCWTCGQPLGVEAGVFVVGPMCLVNLNSAEPPSHYPCALYSATHCPFLNNPDKGRREAYMPSVAQSAGIMIRRNPGVTALIVTRAWTAYRDPLGGPGLLISIGKLNGLPTPAIERVEWYARGREATWAEVNKSLLDGVPALAATCEGDTVCLDELARMVADAQQWMPRDADEVVPTDDGRRVWIPGLGAS